jgi:curved DNA-binding protein CbpA
MKRINARELIKLIKQPAKDFSTNNLYEILEVHKHASLAEIKAAYKKLVQRYHPDKNEGNADKFSKIQNAHLVLSNASTRALYDETGLATVPDGVDFGAVHSLLLSVVMNSIENVSCSDIDFVDVLAISKRVLNESNANYKQQIKKLKKEIIKNNKALKRLSSNSPDNIVMINIKKSIEHNIKQQETALIKLMKEIAIGEAAIDYLKELKFTTDLRQDIYQPNQSNTVNRNNNSSYTGSPTVNDIYNYFFKV